MKKFTDEEFDSFYSIKMRKLSGTHWTPVSVAEKAVDFLALGAHTRVLDLGSGAGKFCIAAAMHSQAFITGVEVRENLVLLSQKLAQSYKLENVNFITADLINIDFGKYDAFYFFNSFEEKIDLTDKIDAENCIDPVQHMRYSNFLKNKLDEAPIGTRVVTYCGGNDVIPDSYTLVKSTNKGKLSFWEKRY